MTEIEIIEQYVCGKQMFKVTVKNGKENIMIVNCSRFEQTAALTYMYNGDEYIGMIDSGKIVEFNGYMTINKE